MTDLPIQTPKTDAAYRHVAAAIAQQKRQEARQEERKEKHEKTKPWWDVVTGLFLLGNGFLVAQGDYRIAGYIFVGFGGAQVLLGLRALWRRRTS